MRRGAQYHHCSRHLSHRLTDGIVTEIQHDSNNVARLGPSAVTVVDAHVVLQVLQVHNKDIIEARKMPIFQ